MLATRPTPRPTRRPTRRPTPRHAPTGELPRGATATSRGRTPAVVIAILALALGWLALAGQSVQADVLMLHDGRMLVGEATSDRRGIVVFRTLVDDQWVDLQFERTQVKQLYRDPGNQADAGSGDDREDGEPTGKPGRPVPARPAPDGALVVAVIPLHGQVGGLQNGSVRGTFA